MGKAFKNGPSKICGRQPLKKILLGPFLNTLLHISHSLANSLVMQSTMHFEENENHIRGFKNIFLHYQWHVRTIIKSGIIVII